MKTQIIQLEEHDDIISTRDKLGWGQTSRIILVWPNQGNILTQQLELNLLQRHSLSLGKQIAFVTQNPLIRSLSRELGIPVFESLREAQSSRWRAARRRKTRVTRRQPRPDLQAMASESRTQAPDWLNHTPTRIVSFGLSLVAVFLVLAALIPSARIEVTPGVKTQITSLAASAYLTENSVEQADGLTAYTTTIVVEGREVLTTTGTTPVPIQPAQGTVRFTNLTDQSVSIPVGTVVSTLGINPVRFTTQREGRVTTGSGKEILLPVTAAAPGIAGNLPAHAIQAIEGSLGLRLSVSNPSKTTGGQDFQVPAPTLKDQEQLYDLLFEKLRNTAQTELQVQYPADLPGGAYAILPSLQFLRVIEETYDPPDLQPASRLELTLRLEFEAWIVPGQALENLASTALDADLPEGFKAIPGTLAIIHITKPSLDESNLAHWKINASRQLQAVVSPAEIASLAAGIRSTHAAAYLAAQLPLQKLPVIHKNISWWPFLPFLPFRVQVLLPEITP